MPNKRYFEVLSCTDAFLDGEPVVLCKCMCGYTFHAPKDDVLSRVEHECEKCGKVSVFPAGSVIGGVFRKNGRRCTHGSSHTKLYKIWQLIRNDMRMVCGRWKNDFSSFKTWSETHDYVEGMILRRRDRSDEYSPENCYWDVKGSQLHHTSRSRYITLGKETHTLTEWSEILGIPRSTLAWKIGKGWKPE